MFSNLKPLRRKCTHNSVPQSSQAIDSFCSNDDAPHIRSGLCNFPHVCGVRESHSLNGRTHTDDDKQRRLSVKRVGVSLARVCSLLAYSRYILGQCSHIAMGDQRERERRWCKMKRTGRRYGMRNNHMCVHRTSTYVHNVHYTPFLCVRTRARVCNSVKRKIL